MERRRGFRTGLVCAGLTFGLMAASPATASHVNTYGKTDQKCRNVIAKLFDKAVSTGDKAIGSCHRDRDAGTIPDTTDCNDLGQADTGKFQALQDKLRSAIASSCTAAGASDRLLAEFTSCPAPCDTLPIANPMANFTEVGECLACMAGAVASQRSTAMLGLPTVPLSSDEQKCRSAISKGFGKRLKVALKSRSKCQKDEDAAGNTSLQPCDSSDPTGAILAATSSAESMFVASCQFVDLSALDSCSDSNVVDLYNCLMLADDTGIDQAFSTSYELPATICPTSLTLKTLAGTGEAGSTASRLDAGWNGIGHGQDLVDQFAYDMAVSCTNPEPPCGTCSFTGFVDSVAQPGAFLRCREDTRQPCSNPLGTDPVCPGSQLCSFYFGPPLPLSASNTPICVLIRALTQPSGTVDLETGDMQFDLSLRAVVHAGLSQTQPCPVCVGDTTPQDGVRDGHCVGGPNGTVNNQPCDVQGFDATFGDTSMDCYPASNTNISSQGLLIQPKFDTGTQSMPFGTKCDFPQNDENCACAVCTNDTTLPCNANSDCVSPGTCTSGGGGPSRKPNACDGGVCTDLGAGALGECASGPDVHYCDGQLRASGKGFLACDPLLGDADCEAIASACTGNDCGHCTLVEKRSCYLDPIVVSGNPDTHSPLIASTFCVPPATGGGINGATGLPAASRAFAQVEVHRNY